MENKICGQVEVSDGILIHYSIFGKGSTKLFFISGLGTSQEIWNDQVKFFIKKENYQICTFDNRGVGQSNCNFERLTTSSMAIDALNVLNGIGWKEPIHLIALSMGGMIAQELAVLLIGQQRLGSLTLGATHAGGINYSVIPPLYGLYLMIRWMGKDAKTKVNREIELHYSKDFRNHQEINEEYFERYERIGRNPLGFFLQVGAIINHRLDATKAAVIRNSNVPLLVCTCSRDLMVKPENSQYLARLLNGKLVIWNAKNFDFCHVINKEFADEFNNEVDLHVQNSLKLNNKE
eukprot:TRINITY_DN1893_c1_g3_i1.p1 TRINITY_DN1893_c1_g3~~TRINITY_DN1893_c1_g3_i1.p1  ORF type:complete len:292 (-),score=104.19 TRINITY_DN1893_c1_g3_i1:145-1020(-)